MHLFTNSVFHGKDHPLIKIYINSNFFYMKMTLNTDHDIDHHRTRSRELPPNLAILGFSSLLTSECLAHIILGIILDLCVAHRSQKFSRVRPGELG